jgi:flagellar hook-associated protein 1 FlgK
MSLTSLLSVAQSALVAHQRAVGVIGHNIANAETPGYTRQRPRLVPVAPNDFQNGPQGRGVDLVAVDRIRSTFYDESWRREAGLGSRYRTLEQALSQISGVIGEPSDTGLGASLDEVIDAFQTLSTNPTDPAAQTVVIGKLQALIGQFHATDARLDQVGLNIGAEFGQAVRDANSLLAELDGLNTRIKQTNGTAPDLLDRRDVILDQLSQQLDVRIIARSNGAADVYVGGLQVVDASGGHQTIGVSGTGPYQIVVGNPPSAVPQAGGRVAGLLDAFTALGAKGTSTARATGIRGQLDDLAAGIVAAFNEIHSDYDPLTKPLQPTLTPAPSPLRAIVALFDPTGVTAGSIALNPTIAANPAQLAAGWSTAPGDNSIALRLGQLRGLLVPVPGASAAGPVSPAITGGAAMALGDFYNGVVGRLGIAARDAANSAAGQDTVIDHLEAQRQNAGGVNLDEEMVRLIEHQQAYAAAARLVKFADEMLQELINLGR